MHLLFVCFGMLHVASSMTWQAHCMISRFRCPVMYQQYTPHARQPQNEPLYGSSVHGLHCAPLCLLLMLPRNLCLTASSLPNRRRQVQHRRGRQHFSASTCRRMPAVTVNLHS